jgi:hypothetical protein
MLTFTFSDGTTSLVSKGTVELPRTGIWIADVHMISQDIPDIGDTVTATLGPVPMIGTVAVAQLVNGIIDLRVVGGAGGLGNPARPKHYHAPLVNHVLTDLIRDAGEVLSTACTPEIIGKPLEAWTTLGLPTGTILAALCAVLECNWRVMADGTTWIGTETWPDCPADFRSITTDGANAAQVVGTDGPAVWPGTLLGGRQVDFVTHDLDQNRTRILFAEVA